METMITLRLPGSLAGQWDNTSWGLEDDPIAWDLRERLGGGDWNRVVTRKIGRGFQIIVEVSVEEAEVLLDWFDLWAGAQEDTLHDVFQDARAYGEGMRWAWEAKKEAQVIRTCADRVKRALEDYRSQHGHS